MAKGKSTFNAYSWSEIQAMAAAGTLTDKVAVGSIKSTNLSGSAPVCLGSTVKGNITYTGSADLIFLGMKDNDARFLLAKDKTGDSLTPFTITPIENNTNIICDIYNALTYEYSSGAEFRNINITELCADSALISVLKSRNSFGTKQAGIMTASEIAFTDQSSTANRYEYFNYCVENNCLPSINNSSKAMLINVSAANIYKLTGEKNNWTVSLIDFDSLTTDNALLDLCLVVSI